MRHPRRTILSTMAALLLAGMAAGAAIGADATGCVGSATSFDSDGTEIQTVTAPGPSATQADPFMVAFDGSVRWEGTTFFTVISNGSWTVTALPFSFSGEITNAAGQTKANGEISPDAYLPFAIPGLVRVTVDLEGSDGLCTVTGWIQFTGNPLSSPAGWAAIVLTVLGGIGLLLALRMLIHVPDVPVGQNRSGRVILGVLAGLVLGLGVATLMVMYGVVGLGTMTPVLVVGGTALFGFVLGLLPRRTVVA